MGDSSEKTFKIGSRKSELALIQTNHVIACLHKLHPNYKFEIVTMDTLGDKILNRPLPKIGEKSLFTKELEEALEEGTIDFIVHSLKDLPTTLPERKVIGAVLQREDPRDCLILNKKNKDLTLRTLPKDSVIGTSSLRRTAQLCHKYPNIKVQNIRGNLNTRLRKLYESDIYDGIVLAYAGVHRMGWEDKISEILKDDDMLYAVGQGALAVECREEDEETVLLLNSLSHRETILLVLAERSFLKKLEGGCSAPVAVRSTFKDDILTLTGMVSSLNGCEFVKSSLECKLFDTNYEESGEPARKRICKTSRLFCGLSPGKIELIHMEAAEKLGIDLANELIAQGALVIMKAAKEEVTKDIKN